MFKEALNRAAAETQAHLKQSIRCHGQSTVTQAMEYAAAGGKGLRGFLVLEGSRMFGVEHFRALGAASAIEALHAYSLIHDDLPCMDDDDFRRGKPTVHRKWDEATAVLAGDGLQALAFRELTGWGVDAPGEMISGLAIAAELMVRGQAMDIEAESAEVPLTIDEITKLQSMKTGALITWSCQAGPLLAGESDSDMNVFGRKLGLAFQIADDILDVEGDPTKAGKRLQKDAGAGKATFVSLLGLQGAKAQARDLVEEAEAALAPYGVKAETLRQAARFVISREM